MIGVALSTNAIYLAAWKLWVEWRQVAVQKGDYLDVAMGEAAVVNELVEYMSYLFLLEGQ